MHVTICSLLSTLFEQTVPGFVQVITTPPFFKDISQTCCIVSFPLPLAKDLFTTVIKGWRNTKQFQISTLGLLWPSTSNRFFCNIRSLCFSLSVVALGGDLSRKVAEAQQNKVSNCKIVYMVLLCQISYYSLN